MDTNKLLYWSPVFRWEIVDGCLKIELFNYGQQFSGLFPEFYFYTQKGILEVSAKYCYAAHESRLHQNDRCKRFALCLVLTVRFRSLAPWGKLFQLFI